MSKENKDLANRTYFHDRGFITGNNEPPDEFRRWWNPVGSDPVEGSIGGHDHCPKWMQSRDGRMGWSSGISAEKAWQLQCYQNEYNESKFDHAESGTGIYYALYNQHKAPPDADQQDAEILKESGSMNEFWHVTNILANKFNMNKIVAKDTPELSP